MPYFLQFPLEVPLIFPPATWSLYTLFVFGIPEMLCSIVLRVSEKTKQNKTKQNKTNKTNKNKNTHTKKKKKTFKQFSFLYVVVHNFSEISHCPMNSSSEGLSYNIKMQTQFALTLSSCSGE